MKWLFAAAVVADIFNMSVTGVSPMLVASAALCLFGVWYHR